MNKARFFTLLLPLVLRAESPTLVLPDATGTFDVAGALADRGASPASNPFKNRRRTRAAVRELTLAVSSVAVGAGPQEASAIINGRAYSSGDRVEGLRILAIGADGIDLCEGSVRLHLPVEDTPSRLLVP